MQTEMLRDLRMRPRAAVVMPLPTELTTPPVTKMNFGMLSVGPGAGQNKWRHLRECRPPRILQGAQKADKRIASTARLQLELFGQRIERKRQRRPEGRAGEGVGECAGERAGAGVVAPA